MGLDALIRKAIHTVSRAAPGAPALRVKDYDGRLAWTAETAVGLDAPVRAVANQDETARWRIVAVPGTPSFAESWCGFADRMRGAFEVVAVERPGYWGSGGDRPVFGVDAQVRAITPFLARRRGERILLIGHSFSAATALYLASLQPRAADALMLLSGLYDKPTAHLDLQQRFFSENKLGERLGPAIDHCIAEVGSHPENRRAAVDAAARLKTPTAVVHGTWDDVVPYSAADKFMAVLPESARPELRPLSRSGHYPNVFDMRRLAEECGRLVARA